MCIGLVGSSALGDNTPLPYSMVWYRVTYHSTKSCAWLLSGSCGC